MPTNARRILFGFLFFAALSASLFLPAVWQGEYAPLWTGGCVRLLGGAALFLLLPLSPPLPNRKGGRVAIAAVLLLFAVALNNFPFYALATGRASLSLPAVGGIALLFSCLATALFEETLFRFLLFPLLYAKWKSHGVFPALLLSSLLFGCFHFSNLFFGAELGATLLQVGYSTLVGGAAASLYFLTKKKVFPLAFHALFNFGGALVPRFGSGELALPFVILSTALLSLAAGAATLWAVWKEK